ncbi:SulP family inorganic anion transporter [Rhizobacter sp. Root404]|uniref:SulP family inorganic anion transporter n=1 Tax=Rhizobacter sp. Root404 TaxID=1736528 RepID=UPI0006F7AF05|nr:SulP family inorganic anion transporter [Rhizobacter sp. Root404]KQW35883.1 sulfate transporter [Rhizobacter sp. Root404]
MTALLSRVFGPWVGRVDKLTLRADLIAGILGALLVLPQGFAFAALAGLPPEYGLYTAIVPCVIAALFGSSLHVVSGPTNANSLALFATLAPLAAVGSPAYIQLALAVTVLVGVMQWLIGVLRLGSIANFISPSALRGFMTGAAALIAVHSLTDLMGLPAPEKHGTGALFLHIGQHLDNLQPGALLVGAFTLAAVLVLRRMLPKWPFMLLGLIAGTALAALLNSVSPWPQWGAIAVVGSIPPIVPRFHWPAVALSSIPELLSIAFALTIVALGQSISIAKAVAARSGQAIDANREFRGQGLSNIVGGFFSSYVSCGSLNRSMPNLEAGARTPLAAVFASLWLLLLIAFTAPLLALIPMSAIAALLLVIAWSLFDIPGWRRLARHSRQDFAIALVTGLATMTIRIEMAILLGTILSLVTYLYRTSRPFMRVMGFDSVEPERPFVVRADVPAPLPECPQLKMIRMEGEVYFGAVPHVADQLRDLRAEPAKHLLVMAKSMNFIDVPAAELWRDEMIKRRAAGGDLYFHRPRPPVLELWQRVNFTTELGADHIFATKRIAIAMIFDRLDRDICATCTARVFEECKTLPPPVAAVA